MELITELATPAELTGYVREETDGGLPFAGLFPVLEVPDVEYELTNANLVDVGEVARYRSWDAVPPIGKRPGVEIIGGEIPPLGWSYRLNEKDIARFERVRAGVADRFDQGVLDVLFNDAVRAARAVQNRITLAHGQLATTGVVILTELGNVDSASAVRATFAVPSTQMGVVPAGAVWSDHANSVPITDLKAWEAIYRTNNGGRNPDAWGISSEVMADLVFNTQVRTLAPVMGVVPGIIGDATVAQVLRASGVNAPLVVMNDVERPALDGTGTARVIGNRFVIGVRAGMGSTLFGAAPSASMLAGNAQLEFRDAPGIVAFSQKSLRPPQIVTTAETVALPVLRDPKALFSASV